MANNYLTLSIHNEKKYVNLNLGTLIKDLLILSLCVSIGIGFGILFPYVSQFTMTYIVGLVYILSSLPIMIKIIIKLILTFTVGYFFDVSQFVDNFSFGFILLSVGILLYTIFIVVNITPLLICSISIISIGLSLLIAFY